MVVDMPKGTYSNKKNAKKNARLLKKLLDVMLLKLRVTKKILTLLANL